MTPYEIWVLMAADGYEYNLFTIEAEIGLTDAQIKTEVIARLNAIIAKINTPTPDTLEVRRGLIGPGPEQARVFRHEEKTPL